MVFSLDFWFGPIVNLWTEWLRSSPLPRTPNKTEITNHKNTKIHHCAHSITPILMGRRARDRHRRSTGKHGNAHTKYWSQFYSTFFHKKNETKVINWLFERVPLFRCSVIPSLEVPLSLRHHHHLTRLRHHRASNSERAHTRTVVFSRKITSNRIGAKLFVD